MHELAITESVVDAIVEKVGDGPIAVVRLEIGKLSGLVADSVRFCFEIVASGTGLEDARLDIDEPIMLCPCGSADLDVLSGQQLRIISVEVR